MKYSQHNKNPDYCFLVIYITYIYLYTLSDKKKVHSICSALPYLFTFFCRNSIAVVALGGSLLRGGKFKVFRAAVVGLPSPAETGTPPEDVRVTGPGDSGAPYTSADALVVLGW